jgi:universal stress protein E
MSEIKNILVGVDLLQSRQGSVSPPVAEAVKQALWLAERLSSEVTFFCALDLPAEDDLYTPLGDHQRLARQIEASAQEALSKLVEHAQRCGVKVASKWAVGEGWVELTREAIDARYDLVVVGTRNQGAVRRALFGSTAMKLLHNCPAPVWVTKPEPQPAPKSLLVASDFSEVSDRALKLASEISSASNAKLHLIHVVESPFAQLWEAGLLEAQREAVYHERDRAAAQHRLEQQLARVSPGKDANAVVTVVEGATVADNAIVEYIEAHHIDLLMAGTSARRGLAGVFLGNTAERLLTAVNCSLLVVKPADFVCPVRLESYRYAQPATYL